MISENLKLFFFCIKVVLTLYQINIKRSGCTGTLFQWQVYNLANMGVTVAGNGIGEEHILGCLFRFGHHQKHREGATALSLVKDKAADLSWLFEGRNCHVPLSATRDVF